jgi:exodeoxyribonuclease VIII
MTENNTTTSFAQYDYHGDTERIGKSGLDLIHQAPIKYYLERLAPDRIPLDTKALRLGKFYHAYLFEPHTLETDFYILRESEKLAEIGGVKPRVTTAYKDWMAEEVAKCGDRVLIQEDYADQADPMKAALMRNPIIRELLESPGKTEFPILWEMENGVQAKSKLDKFIPKFISMSEETAKLDGCYVILDYKTADDASLIGFTRSVKKYRYDVQNAMYLDAIDYAGGGNLGAPVVFVFIVQEKSYPYLCEVYELAEEDIEAAREQYLSDAEVYKTCMQKWRETGDPFEAFHGYSESPAINTIFLQGGGW